VRRLMGSTAKNMCHVRPRFHADRSDCASKMMFGQRQTQSSPLFGLAAVGSARTLEQPQHFICAMPIKYRRTSSRKFPFWLADDKGYSHRSPRPE